MPLATRAPVFAVAAVLVVRLADELGAFLPSGALESFRADLGLTYAQAGAVLALIAPGALVGTVFAVAADRHSRRVIASGGAFGFAACMAAFATGRSFAVLAVAGFVLGMASTAMVDAAEVALVDMAGDDLRTFLARGNLMATVGDVVGPALLALVALLGLSWRASFWVAAAVLGVYGVALAVAPLPPPPAAPAREVDGGGSSTRRVLSVALDRRVWVVGVMSLLMGPFDEPLVGFAIALLERERGASAAVATVVALVGVSGGLLTFTVLARRFHGVPESRLLVAAGVTMTAGAAVIAFVPIPAVVALGAFVTTVGLDLGWLALQHRILTLRPGEVGATKAVVTAVEFVGAAVPIGIGVVADGAGLVAAVGLYAVLGLAFTGLAVTTARSGGRRVEDGVVSTAAGG